MDEDFWEGLGKIGAFAIPALIIAICNMEPPSIDPNEDNYKKALEAKRAFLQVHFANMDPEEQEKYNPKKKLDNEPKSHYYDYEQDSYESNSDYERHRELNREEIPLKSKTIKRKSYFDELLTEGSKNNSSSRYDKYRSSRYDKYRSSKYNNYPHYNDRLSKNRAYLENRINRTKSYYERLSTN